MRRSKARVVWLPPEPANSVTGVPTTVWGSTPLLQVTGVDPTASVEVPLVIDAPADPTVATLSDVENSGYRLRRIVGKIFVIGDTIDDQSGITLVGVTAGLIVRRVDQLGVSLASQVGLNQAQASPSELENSMDPWIWRRSWLIANPTLFTQPVGGLPTNAFWNNIQTSSALDGPHVDQKTARLVGPEERLFLDISMTALNNPSDVSEIPYTVDIFYELRVLGSMRSSSGNRRNASR